VASKKLWCTLLLVSFPKLSRKIHILSRKSNSLYLNS
jgi:hypothetical protein